VNGTETSRWLNRRSRSGAASEPAGSRRRSAEWGVGFRESLWLYAIGLACLFLAGSFLATRTQAGSSHFPLWELLLALGIIALAGGVLATFIRDEPGPPRRSARTPTAPEDEATEVDEPPEPSTGEGSDEEAEPESSRTPARTSGEPEEPVAPQVVRPPRPFPTRGPGDPSGSVEAIEEIDQLVRDLRPRVPVVRPPVSPRSGRPARAEAGSSARSRGGTGERCGSCQRPLMGGAPLRCEGCGSALCDYCFDGLAPPPCPSCAETGSVRS
jgi:hypothetical protein